MYLSESDIYCLSHGGYEIRPRASIGILIIRQKAGDNLRIAFPRPAHEAIHRMFVGVTKKLSDIMEPIEGENDT